MGDETELDRNFSQPAAGRRLLVERLLELLWGQQPFVEQQLAERAAGDMGRFHMSSIGAHPSRVEGGFSAQAGAAAPS